MPQEFLKDSDATLDFAIDWSQWLGDDIISQSTWVADDGLTIAETPAPTVDGALTTVWLSDGEIGMSYSVTNHIVTAGGREDDRTLTVYVSEQ